MSAIASSSIAGGKNFVLDFPYEYKPALLMPVNFDMQIPIGYYVKRRY